MPRFVYLCRMKCYDNFISLGYFCSIAQELERIGLRSTSSPFDWCISDFEGVISAIGNNFEGFLDYELLCQSTNDRKHYFNTEYKIWFFHDFDQYSPLKRQIDKVRRKYSRRIERFYTNIHRPTLFIRYISNEELTANGKSAELEYIEKNLDTITSLLKSFNPDNEIIFIANNGVESDVINIYNVAPDDADTVAREPLNKHDSLKQMFDSFDFPGKDENLSRYLRKESRKKNCLRHNAKTISNILKGIFLRPYIHEKQITVSGK